MQHYRYPDNIEDLKVYNLAGEEVKLKNFKDVFELIKGHEISVIALFTGFERILKKIYIME